MKKYILSGIFALISALAMAVPAKRGVYKTITLTDGTSVKVSLVGDEFEHYWVDSLGNKYVVSDNSDVYTQYVPNGQAKARRIQANTMRTQRLGQNTNTDIFKGRKKGLVILVEFTDQKFKDSDPKTLYTRIANETNYSEGYFVGSVKDYFLAQSRGQFELDFDVVGPVQLENSVAYYGANDRYGNDLRPEQMVEEACHAIAGQVNFADYDWDGDGEVEQVYIIYAGYGEADSQRANTIWPHEWNLSSTGSVLYLDNVKIDTYACSNEIDYEGQIAGIGTMCHEFSHCMGIPDLYDTAYTGNFGMGDFDLMNSGSYNGNAFCPAGYTAYERMVSGWIEPIEITKGMSLAVSGMKGISEGGEVYKIINSGNKDEYFMVENRTASGWDKELPAFGVMITHVDYDASIWENNYVNTTSGSDNYHQRMTIFHADDDDDSKYFNTSSKQYFKKTLAGDLYPYQGNDSLSATSKPANATYTPNIDGKSYMDIAIRHIEVDGAGQASMTFGPNSYVKPKNEVLFQETFSNCAGLGGNDGLFSGNASIGSSTFLPDNAGWSSKRSYGAKGCARFGTSTIAGEATTPSIDVDGTATLSFRAAPWGMDGKTLDLDVSGDATISPYRFTMSTGSMKTFTATIRGTGTVRITFKPEQRLFLDDVVVTNGINAIQAISTSTNNEQIAIYSVNGVKIDKPVRGINIVKYADGSVRKMIIR